MGKKKKKDLLIGVDFGGTNIVTAVVDTHGAIVAKTKIAAEIPRGVAQVVANITQSMRDATARADVALDNVIAIGLGSPGPLNSREGIVINPPNLNGWNNVPLRRMIEDEFRLPVVLDNDANAAAFGEFWAGAGKDVNTLVCFTLGTGVGGGIIIDGKLLRGPDDTGGELGHCTIDYDGYPCKCGNRGCLETYVSATAIVRRMRDAIECGEKTIIFELVDGHLDRLTSKLVHTALLKGDALAARIMHETGVFLGIGIANAVNALNPDMIVICGGVIEAGEHLFAPAREEVKKRAFEGPARRAQIVPAVLGDDAGCIGAAGIALDALKNNDKKHLSNHESSRRETND
jgi:glucokinase